MAPTARFSRVPVGDEEDIFEGLIASCQGFIGHLFGYALELRDTFSLSIVVDSDGG